MAIAQRVAGYSPGEADLLRRAMSKKDREHLDEEYERFSAGMRDVGFSIAAIKTLWDTLLPFSNYAFNRAHAAGYALLSYQTAYLKANYPAEYMAALLTSVGDDKDKAAAYLTECRKMGITVLPPDVNSSAREFTAVGDDIRFGLGAVRNLGCDVVDLIISARTRQGPFTDFFDFLRKVDAAVCNRRVVESLIKAGAFDSLGHPRKGLYELHGEAIDVAMASKRAAAIGQFELFGELTPNAAISRPFDLPVPAASWDARRQLAFERELLGHYVSRHPLQEVAHLLAGRADTSIASIKGGHIADGAQVIVAGIITSLTCRVNRNGEPWAVAQLEDLAAGIEVLLFAQTYAAVGSKLAEDTIVLVRARVAHRNDTSSLIAGDVVIPDLP